MELAASLADAVRATCNKQGNHMHRYQILASVDLDTHPTTLAGFRKWLDAAYQAVQRWLEHPAGPDESDASFFAAVANRASKLARRMGAGHLAAPHIAGCGHAKAQDVLGRLLQWTDQQRPVGAWTTHAVAKWLQVSPDKVLTWIRNGELKARNVAETMSSKPKYRIDPADFDSFLAVRTAQQSVPLGRRRRRRAPQ